MYQKEIIIQNPEGLHARPAAAFAKKAAEYKGTKILVKKDGIDANAKSIMSLLSLGAAAGTKITITADGPDEEEAAEALCQIIS